MFYNLIRNIARGLFFFLGLKHEGIHNVPKEGAVILASNHISFYDPIVIAAVLDRQVHFMAKSEFFRNKPFARFLAALNAFPVKRGTPDRKAIKKALTVLEEGKVLGIFPEGTRKRMGTQVDAQAGTALLALKSDVFVIPVACIGTERTIPIGWFKPVKVIFGKPIKYDNDKDKINSRILEDYSQVIAEEINHLLINKEGFKLNASNNYDR